MKGLSGNKKIFKSNKLISELYKWILMHILKKNHVKNNGKGNIIKNNALFLNTKVVFNGQNNLLLIGADSRVIDYDIFIQGDNNCIEIGSNCSLKGGSIWIEDNCNKIIRVC